ncbi:MAG: alginate export family protein [Gammaproteobacteria bacterium]|nr:alginate export family protein [Gammaproteobacteria bacterium]
MFSKVSRSTTSLFVLCTALLISNTLLAADGPWSLSDALGLDNGFTLGGEHQSRFEHYDGNVFVGTSPNDGAFFLRTTLDARYRKDGFSAQVEMMDSRQGQADRDTRLSNSHVSTLDLLQANVAYKFGANSANEIRVGRFTQDWGSRTLIARNRYRNTINTLDGVSFSHKQANGNEFKFLSAQPVRRTPRDRLSLLDNDHRGDKSSEALRVHGVFASLPNLLPTFLNKDLDLETYYIALKEKDTRKLQTSNRDLHTFGFRVRSTAAVNEWDINLESIFQTGERRGSSNSLDTLDLDHQAFYQRVELAYSFDTPYRLRAIFEFNYASGDESPLDRDSGRFDTILGVSAFEFGPVSLYAPISRSNIITPGIRLTATLWKNVALMADYRHFWLAEDKDSWGRTGQRDVTGKSGDYMGQHLELRVRWSVVPGNVRLDSGLILLDSKDLINEQSTYFYIGTNIDF